MILDVHNHLPVVGEERSFAQSKEMLLADMERDRVSRSILIPDNITPSPIGDLDTCLQLAEGEPRLSLLGTIDIQTHGEERLAKLEALLEQRKIVGMKIFPGHDPIYPTDPRLAPVYRLCQACQAPMMIHTGGNSDHPEVAQYNDPKYIVQVAQQYPTLNIIIAHYFFPEVDYCYELTHSFDNIYFDTSGLADEEVEAVTGVERIRRVLLQTLAGNPVKVLFGSDYAMCDRARHIKLIRELPVEERVREGIFWRNGKTLFKLDSLKDIHSSAKSQSSPR